MKHFLTDQEIEDTAWYAHELIQSNRKAAYWPPKGDSYHKLKQYADDGK